MDGKRFDEIVQTYWGRASRRALLFGIAPGLAAALIALTAVNTEAKKKKKTLCHGGQTIAVPKKKVRSHLAHGDTIGPCPTSPPPPPCRQLMVSCTNSCCAGLICEDVGGCRPPSSPPGTYCCADTGRDCLESCDCCGVLQCSERQGNTCRECGFVLDACDAANGNNDCCLDGLTCGSNGCEPDDLCCLGVGGECFDGCDCCAAFGCSERSGFTCQECQYPGSDCSPANGNADCCLEDSTCSDNGCDDEPNAVCCLGEGSACLDPCDCCADFDCAFEDGADFGSCTPFAPLAAGATATRSDPRRVTPNGGHGKRKRTHHTGADDRYRRQLSRGTRRKTPLN